ncbi:MAG: TolC family protein [Saprospiraceae bacterium]
MKGISNVRSIVFCFLIYIAVGSSVEAQVITLEEFVENVLNNHPLAKQAGLYNDIASATLLGAKGAFDPLLGYEMKQKQFDHKNYYNMAIGDLTIPTPLGININTGYEVNSGLFLNPEHKTPSNGLIFGGVSVQLARGLIIDDRRANLRMANIGIELGNRLNQEEINLLIFQAVQHYLAWYQGYHNVALWKDVYMNAQERIKAVVSQVRSGDRPALDSIEANIQLQQILIQRTNAEWELQKARNMLNTYWWNDQEMLNLPINSKPISFEVPLIPSSLSLSVIDEIQFMDNHPTLRQYALKLGQLEVEQSLKKDKLKPEITLSYNPLFEPFQTRALENLTLNNYKLGVKFKIPLYLRKERSEIRLVNYKIQKVELQKKHQTATFFAQYQTFKLEWENTLEQKKMFLEAVQLYRQMYEAEIKLWEMGESSLFLVNTREQSWIQAKIKLTEISAKNYLAYFALRWSVGDLVKLFD